MVKWIDNCARKVYSQNGEDGIIGHVFSVIGYESCQFLEFGYGIPQCNAWNLMKSHGFGGVFIDSAIDALPVGEGVETIPAWLTVANINNIIGITNLPREIDFLSIDVDGVDYWLWEALETSARLAVIEYNAGLGPDVSWTVPYHPAFDRHKRGAMPDYSGASLVALKRLGDRKGYRLIGCDPDGINAFFLHKDAFAPGIETQTPREAYRKWRYRMATESGADKLEWVTVTR